MLIDALKVNYVEDITSFFPKQQHDISQVFDNLKAKDKFALLFSAREEGDYIDDMIAAAAFFAEQVNDNELFRNHCVLNLSVNDSIVEQTTAFIYNNLPLFMSDADFARLDSLTTPFAIHERMLRNYDNLISSMGNYISDFVYLEPLGISGDALIQLQKQGY